MLSIEKDIEKADRSLDEKENNEDNVS